MKPITLLFLMTAFVAGTLSAYVNHAQAQINPLTQKSTTMTQSDTQIIEAQKKNYPMDTCPVTGNKLGSMGKPIDYVYRYKGTDGKEHARLVRFCCPACPAEFKKNPDKYMKKVDDAYKAKGMTPPTM